MWLRGHSTSFQCILTAPRFVLLAADELLGSRAMCALGVVDFLEAVVRLADSLRFPSRQQLKRHNVKVSLTIFTVGEWSGTLAEQRAGQAELFLSKTVAWESSAFGRPKLQL
jgi:hypothetical protein